MLKKNKLAILGCGGHSKVVYEIAQLNGYGEIFFFDDKVIDKKKIFGNTASLIKNKKNIIDLFIAIGSNSTRKLKYNQLKDKFNIINLVHPNTTISKKVKIGKGNVIMPGSVINADVSIGNGSIINTASIIDHECVISNFVHVSPGVKIGGQVKVGECSWLGIGSTIINNINIEKNVILGASSLLINTAKKNCIYKGIPAKQSNE